MSMNECVNGQEKVEAPYPPDVLKDWLRKNSPMEFYNSMKYKVFGQDEELRKACILIYGWIKNVLCEPADKKFHFLIEGKSGCGKSTFANALRQVLPCPVVVADASSITPSGYKGADIGDLVNCKEMENFYYCGVLVLDEIDKLMAPTDGTSGNFHLEALHTLLKLMDGGTISDREGNTFPCERILVIGMGAFSDLRESQKKTRSIGFIEPSQPVQSEKLFDDRCRSVYSSAARELQPDKSSITKELLTEYCGSEQLMGRFVTILHFKSLGRALYKRIIIQTTSEIRSIYGSNFRICHERSEQIVVAALNSEFGARYVKSAVWEEFLNHPYGYCISFDGKPAESNVLGTDLAVDEDWEDFLELLEIEYCA